MVKIIDSVITFYEGRERLDISLLSSKSFYAVKLSKQCNENIVIILSTNGEYRCWKPLGFERSIIYG